MRNSIITKLLVVLSLILIGTTAVSLYFADKNVRNIVEDTQVQLLKERVDTLLRMLAEQSKKLAMTAHPEAYLEDFQRTALNMIRTSYYTNDSVVSRSYPLIITKDRKTILLPQMENGQDLHNAETLIRDSLQYGSGAPHIVIKNRDTMGVFVCFAPWAWQLGYIVPVKVMYDASNRLQSILIWTLLFGTGAALLAISFAVYRLVKPLRNLRKAADALALENYSLPFSKDFVNKDEIGSLARSLERMRLVIEERIAELKGTNIALQKEIQAREMADAARLSQELDYQEIFNATSEAIIIFDTEEREILHVNDTMLELFDYTLDQVVGGKVDLVLQDSEAVAINQFNRNLERAIAGERQVFEWSIKKQNGSDMLWTEVSLRSSTLGGRQCVLAVFRDVSERKSAERAKMKMEEQLRHMQQMESVGTLAGGIAHDFNNILTPLLGYAEILIMHLEQGSEQQKEAKAIYAAGLRARDLVKQILTISRKGELTLRSLFVQDEITEAYNLIKASVSKNIAIICDIAKDCAPVMAEPGQIHQIIMNLSTNGYHAMQENGGVLTISLKKMVITDSWLVNSVTLEPGSYVLISVRDTGCGIADEIKNKIFDPYYTTKVAGEGTGLGLSIVHNIVKSIHGALSVESEPGKTVFSVYLPCITENIGSHAIARIDELKTGSESIMFVDDEKSVLDVGQALLERLGYKVSICHGSKSGLESFRVAPDVFDLIITDMTMPDMSGFEFALEIKKIRPTLPVILLTGYSDIINKDEAGKIGIFAILTKPINMSSISNTVRSALDTCCREES